MQLTQYQEDILAYFATHTTNNMYINAKAGCGKSFIATLILKDVEDRSIYVAFNKSIADEMSTKITNPKVKVCTMHSLCNSILLYNLDQNIEKRGIGRQRTTTQVNNYKTYEVVNTIVNQEFEYDVKYDFDYLSWLNENFVKLYNLTRLNYVDLSNGYKGKKAVEEIMNAQSLFFHEDYHLSIATIFDVVSKIDKLSLEKFEKENAYDFTDMLYITLKKLQSNEWKVPGWNYYTNIVIDEAQDLSTIQLYLLLRIKKKQGRYIYILDPKQAIYGFSGSNAYSCQLIKKLYAPIEEFDLPVNYRCAKSHLNYVNNKYHIGIQARPDAPKGTIATIGKDELFDKVKPGDFVVGRKNKWLLPIILELIKMGEPVYIKDTNFVENILKLIKKVKSNNISDVQRQMQQKIKKTQDKLEQENQTENMQATDILDTYNAVLTLIKAFKEKHSTVSKTEFLKYAEKILNTTMTKDAIIVTSIHCVKGLEADTVFVLNEGVPTIMQLMSGEQMSQEYNLSYVALTRAKENLYLVRPEGEEY